MRTPRPFRVIAALALSVQVAAALLGTVGMCLDRPHTHGGVPAPDCPMHHELAEGAVDPSHHHHHGSDAASSSGTAVITCRCSADGLSLFLTPAAIVVEPSGVHSPIVSIASSPTLVQHATDVRVPPLSPPPRLTLS